MKASTKRLVNLTAAVLVGLLLACSSMKEAGPPSGSPVHHLVVLHTNDTHGHPVKFFKDPAPDVGGLGARATIVKRIRGQSKNVLVLDAGDINTGRPESNLFKARPDIEGYNYIGYDAMAIGNHEFDNALGVLREQMKLADFPFLSANVRTKQGELLTLPYIIKEFDGFKVAIFGLTTKETEFVAHQENIRSLVFQDEVEVAKQLVPELRKQADVVIALAHMGTYNSTELGSKRLASEVNGIDLIVDGHSHTKLDAPIVMTDPESGHKTLIVQAWKWGLVLGRVDLFIKKKRVIEYKFEAIPVNLKEVEKKPDGAVVYHVIGEDIPEDPELVRLMKPYVDKVNSLLSKVVGQAQETFFYKGVRKRETALGNLVADSMLWYTKYLGVDFALQNGGGIRTDLPKGPITQRSMHEILPFDNSVVVLTLDGVTVRSLFDFMASISSGQGGFPQVSAGLSITLNTLTKKYEKIMINGEPFNPGRTYKVATNSYLAAGGDGYRMLLNALHRYDSSASLRDVLIKYIEHLGGTIKPHIGGRINFTDQRTHSESMQKAA
ncbi:MAG: 5'-nucleotidase C-terminal domain-containing protein [Deltaproteobacteria bacterium]|nr:5'-nucleotidase C-terminal domain-containing protein [Deltaproteobacteria bacterium]